MSQNLSRNPTPSTDNSKQELRIIDSPKAATIWIAGFFCMAASCYAFGEKENATAFVVGGLFTLFLYKVTKWADSSPVASTDVRPPQHITHCPSSLFSDTKRSSRSPIKIVNPQLIHIQSPLAAPSQPLSPITL